MRSNREDDRAQYVHCSGATPAGARVRPSALHARAVQTTATSNPVRKTRARRCRRSGASASTCELGRWRFTAEATDVAGSLTHCLFRFFSSIACWRFMYSGFSPTPNMGHTLQPLDGHCEERVGWSGKRRAAAASPPVPPHVVTPQARVAFDLGHDHVRRQPTIGIPRPPDPSVSTPSDQP